MLFTAKVTYSKQSLLYSDIITASFFISLIFAYYKMRLLSFSL